MRLIDERTDAGSRHFANLPRSVNAETLRDHLLCLPGTKIINFVDDAVVHGWIDFEYDGRRFVVRVQDEKFSFFVTDPQYSDVSLYRLALHCGQLLGSA